MSLPDHVEALKNKALRANVGDIAARFRWPFYPSRATERFSACPKHPGSKDTLSINSAKNAWICHRCEDSGRDAISFYMHYKNASFVEAIEAITGERLDDVKHETPEQKVARKKQAEADAVAAEREQERRLKQQELYREKARRSGYETWLRSKRFSEFGSGSAVAAYLELRGLDPERLLSLGVSVIHEIDVHDYRHEVAKGDWRTLASGPAMVLPIRRADGAFGAAHQTWIDLTRPKGRLVLVGLDGKTLSSKKMLGSKKGGAIRIYTPENPRRLVVGEGFESTATPLVDPEAFQPDTAYWAAGDVGNMAGRALRDSAGKMVQDQPDMEDLEAFVPPDWCQELVFLGEGDEGDINSKKLTRGLRRAKRLRPGLKAVLVPAPGPGQDMNDLVMRGGQEVTD